MTNETSIAQAGNSYRKGVIFGLTMAEILLLLIFCLLLFIAMLNDTIKDLTSKNEILLNNNNILVENVAKLRTSEKVLIDQIKILKGQRKKDQKIIDEINRDFKVSKEVYELIKGMDLDELSKKIDISEVTGSLTAEELIKIINKANQFDELTNQVQQPEFDSIIEVLDELSTEQLQNLDQILKEIIELDPQLLVEAINKIEGEKNTSKVSEIKMDPLKRKLAESVSLDDLKLLAEGKMEEKVESGNNWPPIISLPEAENYSFKLGSAQLTEIFKDQLNNEIVKQILKTLEEYDADLIEVIGHTDLQPMGIGRLTNLDNIASDYLDGNNEVSLSARDNAGLGYARALSVTKHLLQTPELKDFTILPYSAAQMVTPNHTITTKNDKFESSQLRRIEIRVRRQNR